MDVVLADRSDSIVLWALAREDGSWWAVIEN